MNLYRIHFLHYGEAFAQGETAQAAIAAFKDQAEAFARRLELPLPHFGSATVRKAIYGEVDCDTVHFTIAGHHTTH